MEDVLKKQGYLSINGRRILSFIGMVEDQIFNECMDCGYESNTHAEYEVDGLEEAEVVCPKCGSLHYYEEA